MRNVININENWKFIREDVANASDKSFNASSWESLSVPHTWNAVDGNTGADGYDRGIAWYRKELTIAKHFEGKKVFVEFEGVANVANVYVNGTHLGEHRGGYSTFRFDITDLIEFGTTNTIAVKADNSEIPDVYPLFADFAFYGGMYRDVNLVVVDDVHFNLLDQGSQGVYVSQDNITDELAELTIKTLVSNTNAEEQATSIFVKVLDANGQVVKYTAKDVVVPGNTNAAYELPLKIENPILWQSVENPYLYDIHVTLGQNNDIIDELTIATGLRYFHFDPKEGFFLNGKQMKLKGVSRHQDKYGVGNALSKEDQEYDMELIKEVGANSIRLAHYQHNQYFYDLCDRAGMVIWAEIPFISIMSETDKEGTNAKEQMVELVRQNFNHSSIVMWGVQNEIQIGGMYPELRKVVQELHDITKTEDPTRLTTQAQVMMVPDDDEFHSYTDVVAYNKYYGWYNGKAEDFAPWLDEFHKVNPNTCLGISEYGAEGIIKYHSDEPKVKDYTEEYHALYHETVMKIFNERPFVWGTYVWNFFDFGSPIRDEGGVQGRNNKGLVTFDRKTKKDAFYAYKAIWSNETFIHIASKRFVDRATETINVKVYSTCDEVSLKVNGEVIGTATADDNIFIFENVKLVEGYNEVIATGTRKDETVSDFAMFNKVDEFNPSYECPDKAGSPVANWFPEINLGNVEIKELEITDDVYSSKTPFKEILENEEAAAVIKKYLAEMLENEMFLAMGINMSIDQLKDLAGDIFTPEFIYTINKELTQIKKS